MRKVLHIENLDCPVCAEALQGDIQKIKGVNSVAVDYLTQTITVEVVGEEVLPRVVKIANNFEQVRVLDGGMYAMNGNSHLKEWLLIAISAALLAVGICLGIWAKGDVWTIVQYCVYALAYVAVGYPVIISTVKNVTKGRVFDENFLMTVASIGAMVLGEWSEGVLVMLLYQLGELLQTIAVGSSRRAVTALVQLKSESATLLVDGEQKVVAPEELQVGDVLVVKSGEKIPTDCVLLSKNATLDTKSLTGEAEIRTFEMGAELLSGCINVGGMVEMKVLRAYQDSAVSKILDMVENASAGKAKPEKFITKFARIYTPLVCCIAVLMAVVAPLLEGWIVEGAFVFYNVSRWVKSALSFLVISCPCALVISVPLSYFSGIGACAKHGILVKGSTYLDVVARGKTLAMDKTGTLTEGAFAICGVYAEAENELLQLVAAVERGSAHPIAKAFERVKTEFVAENIQEVAGCGLIAEVNGEQVLVGNAKMLEKYGVEFVARDSIYTLIYVAKNSEFMGVIEVGDRLREEAKDSISTMKALGISNVVMLTGDHAERAEKIANEVGMSAFNAELLPMDKLSVMEEMQQIGAVMYVGDGINDAPVMAQADCAVSMGKLGSAAAVEASDMVLISDKLNALPMAVKIARRTRAVVMQNILFSIVMKLAFMVLGVVGILPLWLAVFADVGVMLLAVLNSFRVRFTGK
ncbi:MAG: cadmium-translocating P-type ATPase [Clostridia bacterium]|nr:cadmium-translocating P-type ATPase [Clostridia bacterium]